MLIATKFSNILRMRGRVFVSGKFCRHVIVPEMGTTIQYSDDDARKS
jgi:hypothetical protein